MRTWCSYVHKKAESEGLTRVLQVGAVTKGQQGEELADIKGMVQAGSRRSVKTANRSCVPIYIEKQ